VVEVDHGGATMWDVQLYNRPWYEALDFTNRLTCLNHALIESGPIVIAGTDPGGANWLDTEGRPEALITFRWVLSTTMPTPEGIVVPFTEIDSHLPDFVARLTPDQRAAQIALRRQSRAHRFRC